MLFSFAIVAALSRRVHTTPIAIQDALNNSITLQPPLPRHIIRSDGQVLPSITSLAAIGDSYSAGIGAGNPLGTDYSLEAGSDYACSRYDQAYPYLIHHDSRLGDPAARDFQFKSCSGALIQDVLDNQISAINANQQVILLSVGGNDVELTNILNQCIFQWAVINPTQVSVAKAAVLANTKYSWLSNINWDDLGRGCENQLARSKELINSDEFSNKLDSVLQVAKSKLAPGGKIYYTGYAKFFAEDMTPACDSVSWSIWLLRLHDLFQPDEKLNTGHRKLMNELVDAVNAKISAAVKAAGPSVRFVDYDDQVGTSGGRFCEAGVDESPRTSNERDGLMFYELDITDPAGHHPAKRDTDGVPSGTFEGHMEELAQITLLIDPDATLVDKDSTPDSAATSRIQLQSLASIEVPNLLPDGYGRVFHPQILLHHLIADATIGMMAQTTGDSDSSSTGTPPKISCKFSSSGPTKRDRIPVKQTRRLEPRGAGKRQPLTSPVGSSVAAYLTFFRKLYKIATKFEIWGPVQAMGWRIVYKGTKIPIGATGVYFDFGKERQHYQMSYLIGCTAVIAVSSKGIYAAHLWEGTEDVDGPSSFDYRYIDSNNEEEDATRDVEEFQAIAVDIFGQQTPAADKPNRPLWRSLVDLQEDYGNPFGTGSDVQIFFMTRSKSIEDRSMWYEEQIQRLTSKFAELVPGATQTIGTYWGDDPNVNEDARGVIVVQYTPYDHNGGESGCDPQARVRVYYENHQQAIIDHTWSAQPSQIVKKRQACDDSDTQPEEEGSGQQVALATYIDPGANRGTWDRLIAFPSDKVSVLVANVVNGPDSAVNAGWTDVMPRAASSGKIVLGYVRTGYLGLSFQKFTTRLGSSQTADWVAQTQEDVDQWYRLYPGNMGGIFFDEGWNDCGPTNQHAELYRFITQETKRKYPGAYTVLNPGAPMPQCFEHSADTLLTAEISYATYTSDGYADVDWVPSDPRKLWHIIYDVPSSQVATIAELARSRNVGMLHITDDIEPNPYDTVPDDAYMQTFMDAVAGGEVLNEGIKLYTGSTQHVESPLRFQVDDFDYSSAKLSWLVTSEAIGYKVYQNGLPILSLTLWMTTVTVGGLEPNAPYTFSITAISSGGLESPRSLVATVKTLALPHKGHTVSSISQSGTETQTIFKAQILVPYAFVRIFMYEQVHDDFGTHCDWAKKPGWPINYDKYDSMCNHWMIEGGTLYEYTGAPDPNTGNSPWVWTWRAEVPFVQTGYDYTWTVPIGTSTVDPSKFMLQVQGYGPMANVFNKCPLDIGGDTDGLPQYCL